MFNFFAQIFGYILSLLYSIVKNYGLAMILFTVLMKLLMLPLSIKQQKSSEMMNQEIMNLYKEEKMNPFSGCLTSILQIILILSVFYMVRSPLTYMQKIPNDTLNTYIGQIQEAGKEVSRAYPQIDIIREVSILKEKNPEDENIQKTEINMNFLGLDLSKIPQQSMNDYTVYIIPILYIITTFISMRMTTKMQKEMMDSKKAKKQEVIEISGGKEEEEENPLDTMMETNRMMSWMMPILSVSIAFIAPLGLALYWLISNIMMIIERIILNKVIKTEEE